MKSKINAHCYFLIGLMGIMLFLGIYAFTYPDIQTKLMPIVVCGIGFILSANELRKELSGEKKEVAVNEKREMVEDQEGPTVVSYVVGFAWVIGLFISMYLIGFFISTILFVFLYMKTHNQSLLASSITAAAMGGAIYLAVVALQMYLFPGILFGG